MFAALGVEIKLAPGQSAALREQALRDAEQAHQQFPLSRMIAHLYADAMIDNGKLAEATAYLRDQAQSYRQDARIHELLAKGYAAQGKLALQHISLAEYYALAGGKKAALDQLLIARKSADASFYDMALIDAREREWKEQVREEMKDAPKEKN